MKILTAHGCNRLVETGIVLLIILTPSYYGSASPSTIVAIELAILLMLLVWGAESIIRGEFVFRRTPLDIVILLFCAGAVISTLFFSEYSYVSHRGLWFVLCISGLYFLVVNHVRSATQLIRLSTVILLVGSILAFWHLMQHVAGFLGPVGRNSADDRIMLSVGNHFAGYMVITIPLAVGASFVLKDIGYRVLLIFASVVMAAAMMLSLIAGAMLVLPFALILLAVPFAKSKETRKGALMILGATVFCLLLVLLWVGYTPILNELLTVTDLKTGSPAGRWSMWKSAFAMFVDASLIGTGIDTFDYIYPKYRLPDMYGRAVFAHSDWLQLLTELGVIGFIIFLFGVVRFFRAVGGGLKSAVAGMNAGETHEPDASSISGNWAKGLLVGGFSSVGAGLAHALVDFNFHIPAIPVLFTIIIALTIVIALSRAPSRRTAITPQEDTSTFVLPQWRIQIGSVRLTGLACLLLIGGGSAFSILRPSVASAYYHDGQQFEAELHWDEAASAYQAALRVSPNNAEYFEALGNLYAKRANLNKGTDRKEKWRRLAVDSYRQAILLCPSYGNYYLELGNLYEVLGEIGNAETAYAEAIASDPNNAFYHRIHGTFRLKQGDVQKAIAAYKKSIAVYPNDFGAILDECYAVISPASSGEVQLFLGITDDIHPQDAAVRLAQFYISKGWYDAAVAEYQRAIDRTPEQIGLWEQLDYLLLKQGKSDEAATVWTRFLELYPQDVRGYAHLAVAHIHQGHFDDAIQQYLTAANIDAASSTHFLNRAADLYMRQGESADALDLWQTVIRSRHRAMPHTVAEAFHRLGQYYDKQDDWIGALNAFQQAIYAVPRNLQYRLHLAKRYYQKELFYEAIQEWERALKLQPENISIHLQLAKVYQQINRQDKAKAHYQRVLRLQPENREVQEALSDMKG